MRKAGRRDKTKLILVFRNFAIAHKNCNADILYITLTAVSTVHIWSHYEACFAVTFGVLYQFRDWKQERKYMIYIHSYKYPYYRLLKTRRRAIVG
jgi:hypothetical protein